MALFFCTYLGIKEIGNSKSENNNLGVNMSNSADNMDEQEKEIAQLSEDINPREDKTPDSLAEATTAPLEDDELGGNAKENDVK